MKRIINYAPRRGPGLFLAILPFLLIGFVYLTASEARLAANPADKLMPSFSAFVAALGRMALNADPLSGQYLFWSDTYLSLLRLIGSLAISTAIGLILGIVIGFIPYIRAGLSALVAVISLIPPLAILPILFILFGLGEPAKIILMVIGVAPYIVRAVALTVDDLPKEQMIKAQTLGGSSWQMVLQIIVPQVMPRLLDVLRLSLGPAWLYLIAAEAISSEGGLGYRIFLVRRYLAMDVILPYVAWITLLAFLMDIALLALQRRCYPWYNPKQG
jgi:NitT/TauT family transport system permease protein